MSVTLSILGAHPNITITVPNAPFSGDPIQAMHSARRRFASYGAERVTLIPHRGKHGEGWNVKPQGLKKKEG